MPCKRRKLPKKNRAATQIKKLPKEECANLYKECLLFFEDCRVEKGGRCWYFENAILPLHSDLVDEYKKLHREEKESV
jgi:hypothetical protein